MITELHNKVAEHKAAAKEILANADGRELNATERSNFDEHIAAGEKAAKLLAHRNETNAAIESLTVGTPAVSEPRKKQSVEQRISSAVRKSFSNPKALSMTGEAALPAELLAGDVATLPQDSVFLSSLIPMRSLDAVSTWSYLRQTAAEQNAAPVAVGAEKPVSVYAVERVDGPIEQIATLSEPVNRAHLADQASLTSFITGQLTAGVVQALDNEIVNGTGVSPSLEGILATEGVQEQEFATDMFTTCRQALTKLQTVGGIVGGADVTFVVNPADFEAMELAQRGDSGYHYGGPVDAGQQKLWGKNVLVSNSVAAGTAIAGRFSDAEIVTRGPIEIAWSEGVGFSKNQIQFRSELRAGLAVFAPMSFVSIAMA